MSYEMFSEAGDQACQRLVDKIVKGTYAAPFEKSITKATIEEMNKVAKIHGEIWDTEPRDNIAIRIEREMGLKPHALDI